MTTTEPDPALSTAPDRPTLRTQYWTLRQRTQMDVVRYQLATWLEARSACDSACRSDIELAVTELMANAFDHGRDNTCSIEIEIGSSSARCAISNKVGPDFGGLPPVDGWSMPGPTQLRGRGLAIVRRLAASTRVHLAGDLLTIEAEFALSPSSELASAVWPVTARSF